ncbi:MAG TPA: cytochrome c oxidase assembly protein [Gaiellaceae bacterium]|nr:cytochrome c oxidase assembly protein [Gaiellaceae bacterium]
MVLVAGAVVASALFGQAVRRLRSRGRADLAGWDRVALFAGGLAAMFVALESPLDRVADEKLLSAHMLQHVLIGDVAPALLVLAVRGPLLFFVLPAAVLGPLARSRGVRAVARALTRPAVVFGLWALNLAIWHVPVVYDAVLTRPLLHEFEHVCWLVAGTLVWTILVDPARHGRLSVPGRVAFAAILFASGQVLTDVLVFSFVPLYPAYPGAYGISALTDQQLSGVVMMVDQLLMLGICVALLLRPRLRRVGAPRLEPSRA